MKPALVNRSRAGSPLVDRPGTSMCTERSPMPASAFVVDRPRCESLNTDLDITDTAEAGGDDMAGSDKSGSEISYMTAPSTPPPPPRRSSKRRSAAYVYEGAREQSKNQARANGKEQDHPGHAAKDTLPASPTVMLLHHHSKPTTAADRRDSPQSASTARKRGPNDPPSIPYDSLPAESPIKAHSRRSLVGAAKAAFRLSMPDLSTITARSRTPSRDARRSCSPAPSPDIPSVPGGSGKPAKLLGLNSWDLAPPPPLLISPARSSSEDTCSDDLRSTTLSRPSSTPNTSRPQSIRGSPGLLGAEYKWQQHHSGYTSALPSPAFSCADGSLRLSAPPPMDLDPIQAAALKIMAQFPDVPYSVHSNRSEPSLRTHRSKSSLAAENLQQRTAPLQNPGLEVPKPLRLPVRPTSAAASTPSVGDMVKASRGKDDDYDDSQETLSKVFVECCSCKHYHDMPDELYDAMINSRGGVVSTEFSAAARCNWCRHVMKTRCCARLSTLVQVKERVH
ncbi:Conserved serine-rich protein [Geosmithia morbida]|uniref:Conserved serine-rich protein n=1 Tax=Geosmithia morbida TaxID=1094350 RepID=A0A9P4YYI8_9HYPO|nr:Conserved serine-rich protein [Geosmithia morbida]KAF4124857.1 Conserved serine-rich protein [Geosmithia morbida]